MLPIQDIWARAILELILTLDIRYRKYCCEAASKSKIAAPDFEKKLSDGEVKLLDATDGNFMDGMAAVIACGSGAAIDAKLAGVPILIFNPINDVDVYTDGREQEMFKTAGELAFFLDDLPQRNMNRIRYVDGDVLSAWEEFYDF